MIDNYANTGEKRIPSGIVSERSPTIFEVKTESGSVTKRHVDQIVKPVRHTLGPYGFFGSKPPTGRNSQRNLKIFV